VFALSKSLESSIRKIELKNEEHLKRAVQTELKVNSTQVEVQSIAQELKNKILKIGKDLLRTVNLKEEVRIRLD
jgi:urease accessory protein UreF